MTPAPALDLTTSLRGDLLGNEPLSTWKCHLVGSKQSQFIIAGQFRVPSSNHSIRYPKVCVSKMAHPDFSYRKFRFFLHCGHFGLGAANTFNNIERVYSRAIAFSNRRCSVPLESTLPNISAMYIKLIYMCIAQVLDLSLTPPSLNRRCVAPFVLSAQTGVHAHTGGGGHHSSYISSRGDTLRTIKMKHKAFTCHNLAHISNQTPKCRPV